MHLHPLIAVGVMVVFRFELILLERPKGAKGRILQPQYSDIYTFVVSSKCIYSVSLLFWLKKQVFNPRFYGTWPHPLEAWCGEVIMTLAEKQQWSIIFTLLCLTVGMMLFGSYFFFLHILYFWIIVLTVVSFSPSLLLMVLWSCVAFQPCQGLQSCSWCLLTAVWSCPWWWRVWNQRHWFCR